VKTCKEAEIWYSLLSQCFKGLERRTLDDLRDIVNSPHFDPQRLLLAEVDGRPAGLIWIKGTFTEDRYELWDLAVLREFWGKGVEDALISKAVGLLSEKGAKLIRAHTFSIEYYVSAYKRHGFKPVRRILRIVWDIQGMKTEPPLEVGVQVRNVGPDDLDLLPNVFVESLRPYWDWWIEDYGGKERLKEVSRAWFNPSSDLIWLVAERKGKVVGLTGFHVKGREAYFFGVMVLPEHRLKGVGWTLMKSALNRLRQLGLERLIVYTMAYLDHLAPGALLYLKSGGKIEAEYIQLERKLSH